ncbi:MAG: hypothetical protein JWQ19_4005 [Subtercola sp.]|nr:hypothetical protein [Subtercola sp.]
MIILVTGGSSGLGEAITRDLARDVNNTVYFTYNNSLANAKKIEDDHKNTVAVKCDFKNESEVNSLAERIAQLNLDMLVNNAYFGAFIKSYFHKTRPEDFLEEFKGNIIPTIIITQAAINAFRKKKNGKIVTILTSALLNVPPTGASIYVANKAYLQKMTKVWASENVKYNITSNTVSPSFMLTSFTKDMDERLVEQMIENHPLKKLLTTDEVAAAVTFLAGATQQITGTDIIINAGTNIQ